ncbi:hypothetical protein [Sphingobacterium sp.]|uniref:hypothetical protein n=1 Tax=Sphingobacterium sp. TaxID=341027 RepID=UPI002FDA896F
MKNYNAYCKFIFVLALFGCVSCKKEKSNTQIVSTNNKTKAGPISAYDFDWEASTYVPYKPSSGTNPLPLPWNSGTTAIDPNLVGDYKKADGWKLVYNTFSPSIVLNDVNYTYFFSLYNVYRGLLRFYVWQPASTIATSHVVHGLGIYGAGATSPMLNFNTQEKIDPTYNLPKFQQVLNQQISSAGGTWLVFQYEMAYDPTISQQAKSFPGYGLQFTSQWSNVTGVTINGTQTGTVKSIPGTPSGGINFGALLIGGVTTFTGGINFVEAFDALIGSRPYTNAINNAASGVVKGFLNAILGGSNGGTSLNLTLNTDIKLDGTMVNNGTIQDLKLKLPGQYNSQTGDGASPKYNQVLGVFNVNSKPTVRINQNFVTIESEDPRSGSMGMETYSDAKVWFDSDAVNITWNPAIINSTSTGATIKNINTDLLVHSDQFYTNVFGIGQGGVEEVGKQRYIVYRNPSASNPAKFSYWADVMSGLGKAGYPPPIYVRVSFDVVPNNGGAKATLVKTFLPSQGL